MSEPTTVALLGAGIMANTVAARLHDHGFELRRYNRTASAIKGTSIVCASPAQAAEEAAVVWSFVHDDTASRAVWFGEDGALTASTNAIMIESSTLSPEYAEDWMREVTSARARPVLAPVTGSRPGATTGNLVAFTAGMNRHLEAADPFLRVVAREVIRIDDAAAVAAVKLLNNALAAVILTGFAETVTAAKALDLDIEKLVETWSRHGWAAPVAGAYGPAMVDSAHQLTNCSLEVMAKDLRYTTAVLGATSTPLIAASAHRFQEALALNLGHREMSAVIETAGERS